MVIDHGQGYYSLYAHASDGSIIVKEGEKVKDGQQIASVGSTGKSTGPHLHLEVGEAKSLDEFLGVKDRAKHRTDAAKIGDLEESLHGKNKKASFNEKIERFNEKLERFNKRLERFNEKLDQKNAERKAKPQID